MIFINRLFLGAAALVALAAAYLIFRRLELYTFPGAAAALGVPLAAAVILAYAALRVRAGAARAVVRELVALGCTLLAVECLIAVAAPELPSTQLVRARVAAKLGVDFDLRTKSEMVSAMRAQGVDALPGVSREWPRQPRVRQQLPDGFFPLSHAANASIVECNESGRYLILKTDEFGFNNPPALVAGGDVAIAAVGASFALGHCIEPQFSLIGRLRASYPSIANFGMAGSSTLSILASFREYVEPLQPPLVLWIMHPWTADVADEAADPLLSRYLDPAFSQRLLSNQAAVNRVWRDLAIAEQHEFDRRSKEVIEEQASRRFTRIMFLPEIRRRLDYGAAWRRPPPPPDLTVFNEALRLARRTTESWGGRFVVLIMPLYAEVVTLQMQESLRHDRLAADLRSDGFEVIDVAEFAMAQPDPRGLYTMRISNHPHAEGYALLADFVERELRARFPDQLRLAAGPELNHE